MSNRLHPVTARDAIRVFNAVGGKELPGKGSHVKIDREDWLRPVVIPMHKGDLSVGVLRSNIRTAGMTVNEFLDLL